MKWANSSYSAHKTYIIRYHVCQSSACAVNTPAKMATKSCPCVSQQVLTKYYEALYLWKYNDRAHGVKVQLRVPYRGKRLLISCTPQPDYPRGGVRGTLRVWVDLGASLDALDRKRNVVFRRQVEPLITRSSSPSELIHNPINKNAILLPRA